MVRRSSMPVGVLAFLALLWGAPVLGQEPQAASSAAQPASCPEGAITSIDLDRRTVFDPDSTDVSILKWVYGAMNVVHVTTTASFIRRELLFDVGDCYEEVVVTESQRLLDGHHFLALARITTQDDGSGGKSVLVHTEDEWSTQVDVGVTYDAGLTLETLEVTEENFLGQGIFAEFNHHERLEAKSQSLRLSTPRFFGRTDAGIQLGRDRPGNFFNQYIRYPFVGETGRISLREGYDRSTGYFAYAPPDAEPFSQVVVPVDREVIELSAARRLGAVRRSWIVGLTLSRDVSRYDPPSAVFEGNFDDLQPVPADAPARLFGQLSPTAATRVWLHAGMPRLIFRDYVGLDGVRDRLLVGLGYYLGLTVGKGFDALTPADVPGVNDYFGRVNGYFTAPIGSSLVHGRASVESRHDDGAWRDVLATGEFVTYLRNHVLPGQTFFLRTSLVGGWHTTIPFQVNLGGREGVRSLQEDRFPGGRMVRFVGEDRIAFPWPQRSVDLGMTFFGDLGRVWPGDAPYGVDSGWQAAVGVGLRIGLPSRTGRVWRTDLTFPIGDQGVSPVFRVTFEFNRLRWGFDTQEMLRSRRFALGAENF